MNRTMHTLETAEQTLTTKRVTALATLSTLLYLTTLTLEIPALNTTFLFATTTSLAILYARGLNRVKHHLQNRD